MFNIALGIYIIVAILVIAGGTAQLSRTQGTAAILFFIGALTSFILFGMKWFSSKAGIFSLTPVSWPPLINTCPDYLVFYQRSMPDGTKQDFCIDRIGVSKNGALKKFPAGDDAPAANDYYFSLATRRSDPAGRNQELCQRAIAAGLTWEGITNGESCMTADGPVAPPSATGDGCPTPM